MVWRNGNDGELRQTVNLFFYRLGSSNLSSSTEIWKFGRVVYGSGLENRRCLKASRSSNLLASAITGVYISWLDSRSDKAKVAGSSPAAPTTYCAS